MWLKWRTQEVVAACPPLQNSATHLPSKSGTEQKELGLDTTVLCSSHLRMFIFLQNRIIQQSSKWHSPTDLGLHIKWLGNMNPGLQKLSLTRVLRLHSTLQDQANIWLALVLIHSTAFHPCKWEQFSTGSSNSSME